MQSDSETPSDSSWLAPPGPREGLGHYFEVIRERLRLIIACVVLATVAAGVYVKLTPRSWQAESRLLVTPVNSETSLIGLGLITNSSNPTSDVSTAASFVTTPEVAALAVASPNVGHTTAEALLGEVSVAPVAASNVIAITATSSSAARAQAIANAFASATVRYRTQTFHHQLEKIIPTLQARVQALPPAQRTGQGSLGERLATLQTLLAGPDPTVSIQAMAQLPTAPSSPKTKLSIAAGIIVGLIIGLGAAFAMEGLDPRVRREERLRGIIRLPVLARIPRERILSRRAPLRPSDISPTAHESYRMLRIALGVRGASPVSRSIMITGPTSSDGKSTVALNLAATIASAGTQVILIEADLRRPSLGTALGIRAPRSVTDVVTEEVELEDALITVEELGPNLRALLADPPNPYRAEGVLASTEKLVESAEALADYVIFDAPPVAEVSDILPLSRQVDDVLIVARLGHSRADQLVNMGELLVRQGVRPVGMVLVSDGLKHGSGYYVQPRAKRGVRRGMRQRVSAGGTSGL